MDIFATDWYREIQSKTTPGDTLKIYRENHGLTQAQLGETLGGIPRQHVSNMERGIRPMPLIIAAVVALLVTLAVPKRLTAQPMQAPTADTIISSEIQSPSSEPSRVQPAPTPDKSSIDSATDVEIQRRFNELKSELLDKRAKDVDWWHNTTAIFLMLLGILVSIFGYFTFQGFRRTETETRTVVVVVVRQLAIFLMPLGISAFIFGPFSIQRFHKIETEARVRQIEVARSISNSIVVVREVADANIITLTERAVAAATSLQQQGKVEEAIEKWRSIANVAEGADSQLQARAWLSVGGLHDEEDNWEAAIDAYNEAIRLKPDYATAYNNRGITKENLGRLKEAREDYQKALALAQESGNEDLIAMVKHNLSQLDNDQAP